MVKRWLQPFCPPSGQSRRPRQWPGTLLGIALALVPALAIPAEASSADDDAEFFDSYLAAKRDSPRFPEKSLVESTLWGFEENRRPPSLGEAAQSGEAQIDYAESLYRNGQYGLAAQSLARLADADRRHHATRIAILQARLALRGFGQLPAISMADEDGQLVLNQALGALTSSGSRNESESRKTAIRQLQKLAAQKTAPPLSRHRALLWTALLQHQNGQNAEARSTLGEIDANTPLALDLLLVWSRVDATLDPNQCAAIDRRVNDQLPGSPAAWETREALLNSLRRHNAIAQSGEIALGGVTSTAEQIERVDKMLAQLAQAPLAETLSAVPYLPEDNRKRVATLMERRDKLSLERRLNDWLPYLFSYRGRIQNDPAKFFATLNEHLTISRTTVASGDASAKQQLGLLRYDIAQLVGTPPADATANRLFSGLAKWEFGAGYGPDWNPEQRSGSQKEAAAHAAQLRDLLATRAPIDGAARNRTVEAQLKSVSERNNALMNEVRSLAPSIERALRNEVLSGLQQRRQISQQWMNRFAFHALEAFARHDPQRTEPRFPIDKPAPLKLDAPLGPQLAAISGTPQSTTASRISITAAANALQRVIDQGETRELRATAMRLRAQTLIALADTQVSNRATEAVTLYQNLLKDYPDLIDRAETSYQLARAHDASQRPAEHLTSLASLVSNFPGDPRASEAAFRIGEHHFSTADYPRARSAYIAMIAMGDSRYREQAEYKLGWTYYKLGEFREALPQFIAVVDRADEKAKSGVALPDRFQRERVKDSFRAIALSFSNISGEGEIERYFNKPGHRQHLPGIYAGVTAQHLERDRIQDAKKGYESLIRQYPNHSRGPELLAGIVRSGERLGLARLALAEKETYVRRYAIDSAYWKQASAETRSEASSQLKPFLAELAELYHADALQQNNSASRTRAIQYYEQYIAGFPTDPGLAKIVFLRGEALFEAGDFAGALADYDRSAYQLGPHDKAAAASYAALLSSEKLIAQGKTPDERRARLHDLVGRSNRFASTFAGDARVDAVLVKASEDILMLGEPAEAVTLSENLLARNPTGDIRRRAQVTLAHGRFETGAFEPAEKAYQQALATGGHSAADENVMRERYALSIYRQAEAARTSGNLALATTGFMRVVRTVPGSEIVPNAEIDAAALMIETRRWNEAIELLEQFSRQRPQHPLATTVPVRLAVAYENTGRFRQAAEMQETMSQAESSKGATADSALAAQQLLRAAELRDKDGQRELATATLERFLVRFPEPLERASEVRQQLADRSASTGDMTGRDRWLNELIATQKAASSKSSPRVLFLAAQAHVTQGDVRAAEFEHVRLRLPLDKALADKRKAMEQAVRWYDNAARYGVVEVTTAATFKTAELYRLLARDILASERPSGLKQLELEQYTILLEEEALPIEDNAIKLHELNIDRIASGKPGSIYDDWVKRSMIALRQLAPGRFDRVERLSSYFAYTPPKPQPASPAAGPSGSEQKSVREGANAKTGT